MQTSPVLVDATFALGGEHCELGFGAEYAINWEISSAWLGEISMLERPTLQLGYLLVS